MLGLPSPPPPRLFAGLPYAGDGPLAETARAMGAPVLISAGSVWRGPGRFLIAEAVWRYGAVALDSAGFTAMMKGGYRWSVEEYVEAVVTSAHPAHPGAPFPWRWWSSMDYCCEQEIAQDRAEVERRITLTVSTYGEVLRELNRWRDDGAYGLDVPDPMPVLQGRRAEDYLRCAKELAAVIDEADPCRCPWGDLDCPAQLHRDRPGLPALVGLGSVCRRHLHGDEGLLTLLPALDAELPAHVRLHLFGVKGAALLALRPWWGRIASADSMAWDSAARHEAAREYRRTGINPLATAARRAVFLRSWYEAQESGLRATGAAPATRPSALLRRAPGPAQLMLFTQE